MRAEKIEQLKEILKVTAMVYPLKFEHDVVYAGSSISKAFDIIKADEKKLNDYQFIRLKKILQDFNNYYKLNKTRKNYATEFEEKKETAKEIIQDYINKIEMGK